MSIRINNLWLCFVFMALAGSLVLLDKGLFELSYTDSDGFYGQMKPFIEGFSFGDLQTLQYIHFLRYVVVSPFVLGEQYTLGGIYFACILFLFAFPILKLEYDQLGYYMMCLMLLFPIFLSFRAFLVGCGIAYLFIALYHHKSYFLLIASLLISTLSSGVILVWIIIFVLNMRVAYEQYKVFSYLVLIVVFLVFAPSILSKIMYAEEVLEGGLIEYVFRGTLVVSLTEHQWDRATVYLLLIILLVSIVTRGFVGSKSRSFYLSYGALFIGALFEGLGLICGLIVVQMFYLGFKPRGLSENINRDEKC